jgi:hypothetical protein
MTRKDPADVHPISYTWYDEVIISRSKIADPGVAADAQPLSPPKCLRVR